MPQIIVAATGVDPFEEAVMLRERITARDFESDHFARQLVERLTWAVSDARATEQADGGEAEPRQTDRIVESTTAALPGQNMWTPADSKPTKSTQAVH
jgi:hypothetical protein